MAVATAFDASGRDRKVFGASDRELKVLFGVRIPPFVALLTGVKKPDLATGVVLETTGTWWWWWCCCC
jgi:hypothetical protein